MGSRFLFADPTLVGGAAGVFDLGATLFEFNRSNTPVQADFLALRQDWRAVGEAIRLAAEEFRASRGNEPASESAR
jgi:hypothetical protein